MTIFLALLSAAISAIVGSMIIVCCVVGMLRHRVAMSALRIEAALDGPAAEAVKKELEFLKDLRIGG